MGLLAELDFYEILNSHALNRV